MLPECAGTSSGNLALLPESPPPAPSPRLWVGGLVKDGARCPTVHRPFLPPWSSSSSSSSSGSSELRELRLVDVESLKV